MIEVQRSRTIMKHVRAGTAYHERLGIEGERQHSHQGMA
jgi:hypothetical protein